MNMQTLDFAPDDQFPVLTVEDGHYYTAIAGRWETTDDDETEFDYKFIGRDRALLLEAVNDLAGFDPWRLILKIEDHHPDGSVKELSLAEARSHYA